MRLDPHQHRIQYGMVNTKCDLYDPMNSMCNFTLIVFEFFRCCCCCFIYCILFSLVVFVVICDVCDAALMDDNVPATPPSHTDADVCMLLVLLIQLVRLTLMLALHFILLHSYQIYSISECTFCATHGWLVMCVCVCVCPLYVYLVYTLHPSLSLFFKQKKKY